ncbi:integrase domain-containing protein [Yersinia enterocolitica]|uniref:integrase domain-containing protein n=1 Tax=Yersinia enterocolitica TaxID=630 RepID=UPI0028002B3D|nr:integrase domain-containing protein [Yersinia enterocolitica]EKN6335442.1 DNA-binding protein [Yersinia enterocolitica]HDT6098032.1 integrase domain-containing protein [Yersinia enterocolitica]
MSKLSKQLVTLARQSGGSFKTVSDRSKIADRFAARMAKLNIQVRDVKHLKINHIELYIKSRQFENISKRTLQNEMSAIRAIFSIAGRSKIADPQHEKLSNSALGLSDASRDGTKIAINNERYLAALSYTQKHDIGAAAAMQLARVMGLRTEEAVQSAKSLATWRTALLRNDIRLRVVFGTKGGRPRDTTIINREQVLQAVNYALKYANTHNGKLIDKPNLQSAIDKYRNTVRNAGLTGKYAPHSLRYAWAVDALEYHKSNGMSDNEARAMVSMDLGHGDGRGRYVERIYSKVE